jgi:sterol desaturase/sphingolipid hydroxylase (fatty acid hydroxylase superfamily)
MQNKIVWGWVAFWVNYWIIGSLLPVVDVKTRGTAEITKFDLVTNLMLNMAVTLFLFVPLASSFPVLWQRQGDWYDYPAMFVIMFVLSEGVNYHVHRAIHHPALYFMHKAHHSYLQAEPLGAVFVSWHEMLIENPLLVLIAYRWFNMSVFEIVALSLFYSNNSLGTHSGITRSIKPTNWFNKLIIAAMDDKFHAVHHHSFNYNFGQCGLLDVVYGTYMPPTEAMKKVVKDTMKSDREIDARKLDTFSDREATKASS